MKKGLLQSALEVDDCQRSVEIQNFRPWREKKNDVSTTRRFALEDGTSTLCVEACNVKIGHACTLMLLGPAITVKDAIEAVAS